MTEESARGRSQPLRKQQVPYGVTPPTPPNGEGSAGSLIDVPRVAQVSYSSEANDHPIENLFDDSTGPRGSRWVASEPDSPQRIELAFDTPQQITRVELEASEEQTERTQEVALQVSRNGGRSFEELRRQQYNFSPGGATFQREEWNLNLVGVTNLRLDIIPNQSGHGVASLVSLRLYR